jgi:N-acetylglucosaminyl-diphospho-decaprenol L-rhamnosyltransferase
MNFDAPREPREMKQETVSLIEHEELPVGVRVLVVIVNYRTPQLTIQCLKSLQQETAADDSIHVIVVDNHSGDGAVLAEAIRDHGWRPWVNLRITERNGGFSYGNNCGVAPALQSADPPQYYLLLNPDTEVRKGAISALVEHMDSHPRTGISGSSIENQDGSDWSIAFRFPTALGQFEQGIRFGPVSRMLKPWIVARTMGSEAEEVDWVSGACMMVRREMLDDVGLMDDGYFLYFEEVDLALRARRAGWQCWYVPQSRVMHIAGQSTGISESTKAIRRKPGYWFASRTRFFVKSYGIWYARWVDLAYGIGLALNSLRCRLTGREREDPPWMLWDFLKTSVLFRTAGSVRRQLKIG